MKSVVLFLGMLLHCSLMARETTTSICDRVQKTDSSISSIALRAHFHGCVLVARDGTILTRKCYGFADESWRVPNTPEGKFEIASVSKQFTAAAILQLAEVGRLSVKDPVSRFYRQAPEAWREIRIEELLSHTSGIPNNKLKDFTKGMNAHYTMEELIGTFRDRPLAFPPGTQWAYTNTEYYLLAYIIEKVSGEPYGAYLENHIFKPLHMLNSGFVPTRTVVPKMAIGYSRQNGRLVFREYFDRSLEVGAGGIYTTVDDLLRWNQALNHAGFLGEESLRAMFTVHAPGNYGFGWFIDTEPVKREYHEGGDPGFAAFEARYPDKEIVIVVLANEDDAPVREMSESIARELGIL